MIKHVGKHNNRKIVLLYRTVPNEDHMCLVAYSDSLPSTYHDSIMRVLESAAGQQAQNLADELHRNLLPDGRNILNTLHVEGFIKKVPTNQVIITPTTTSSVRLDELNQILADMEQGEDAIRRMAEIDNQRGVRDVGKNPTNLTTEAPDATSADAINTESGALSDADLARMNLEQAKNLLAQIESIKAEAERLTEEAYTMDPSLRPRVKKPTSKTAKKTSVKKAVKAEQPANES